MSLRILFCLTTISIASRMVSDAAEADLERFEFSQVHMGAPIRLVVFASDRATAEDACRAAFSRIAGLEQIMSDYRPDSELTRLSAAAGNGLRSIGNDLFHVLQAAQMLARQSGGAFDVTAGPLTLLWREARQTNSLPGESERATALARTGWQKLKLDPGAQTAILVEPGMRLDLGGIAKGYTGDEALRVLSKHGIDRALFEAGGDIVAGGPPPGADGWRVRLPGNARPITIARAAISTSGDTEQYIEADGVRHSHIVDPRTGNALTSRYLATVVARDGMTADSLATAATILGPDHARALIENHYPGTDLYIRKLDTPLRQ